MQTTLRPPRRTTPTARPAPQETLIAWDIETVPLAVDTLSSAQQKRLLIQSASQAMRDPDLAEPDRIRKAMSLHPELSRVCVISAVRVSDGVIGTPKSWVAPTLDDEADTIQGFLEAVGHSSYRRARWVTMNGKSFDVPYLKARVARHGLGHLVPGNGIFHDYPFKQTPHADLANLWRMPSSLDSLCDHLRVETPKGEMCGADVASAVADGRIDDVRRYCEADVIATAECYLKLGTLVDA